MGSVLLYGPQSITQPLTRALKSQRIRAYLAHHQHIPHKDCIPLAKPLFSLTAKDIPLIQTLYYFPNLQQPGSQTRQEVIHGLTHLLSIIPPHVKVIYGSSTDIYGDQGGRRVTEQTAIHAIQPLQHALLMGEAQAKTHPHLILRMGQVYQHFTALNSRIQQGKMCYSQRRVLLNLIHRTDLLRAIFFLNPHTGTFNITDQQPIALNTLLSLLSGRQGIPIHTPRTWKNHTKGVYASPEKLLSLGFTLQYQKAYSE